MRSSFIVLFTLFFTFGTYGQSTQTYGKIVARVIEAKGNAFVFDPEGGSKRLAFGSRIRDFSDVMVEDSSHVSVVDGDGNEHHLSGGASVKFFNQMIEIKNGNVWSVVKGKRPVFMSSANAVGSFDAGQFIVSVDNVHLKTQLLTLAGEAKFASSLEPDVSIEVPAGHFSFIDDSYERGLPRTPTRVGLRSYKKIKTAFASVKGLERNDFEKTFIEGSSKPLRKIASVPTEAKKGKVIFVKTVQKGRLPASTGKGMTPSSYYEKFKEKTKDSSKISSSKKSPRLGKAKVRMHGFDFQGKKSASRKAASEPDNSKIKIKPVSAKEVEDAAKRTPASMGGSDIVTDINSAFEKSLAGKLQENKRHSEEVNQLIDELKSFKRDYSKHY